MRSAKRFALLTAFLVAAAARPDTAQAFYQKTTLEGTLGQDVSGVWLVVQNVMPSFRVRLDRDPKTITPFKVGPVPKELAPAVGRNLKGVVIKEFTEPGAGDKYGIFVGDVITKLNTSTIGDEKDFAKALEDVKEWFLISVERPALKFTSARIVKIKYSAAEKETEGVSQLAGEQVEVRVSETDLPFRDEIDAAKAKASFFTPTKAQIEELKASWFKLPLPKQVPFVNGEHRVVAAGSYDASMRADDNLKDSFFAIVSTLQGNPMAGGGGRNIAIYGFEKIDANFASGSYVESTLATAPFPISIEFDGRFEMTKLAPYSEKDVEFQSAAAKRDAEKQQAAENKAIQLAPDVPAVAPAAQPAEQPAVAE
jgi:hypothetical protein